MECNYLFLIKNLEVLSSLFPSLIVRFYCSSRSSCIELNASDALFLVDELCLDYLSLRFVTSGLVLIRVDESSFNDVSDFFI